MVLANAHAEEIFQNIWPTIISRCALVKMRARVPVYAAVLVPYRSFLGCDAKWVLAT